MENATTAQKRCQCGAAIPATDWICQDCYWTRVLRPALKCDEAKKRVALPHGDSPEHHIGRVVDLGGGRWFEIRTIKTVVYGEGGQNDLVGAGRFVSAARAETLREAWEASEKQRVIARNARTAAAMAY